MPVPVTSAAWLTPNAGRGGSQDPEFAYINETGQYVQRTFTGQRDPVTGKWAHNETPIVLGILAVPDWFATKHGPGKIGDDTCLVPMHLEPSLIPPGEGYKFVVRIPMLVQGVAQILPWYCRGNIAQREMGFLREAFCHSAEAAAGRLFVYALRTSRPFTTPVRDPTTGALISKRLTAPVWEHVDVMDRDPLIFGEGLVPPSSLIPAPSTPSAPPLLSPAASVPPTAAEVPTTTSAQESVKTDPFARLGAKKGQEGGPQF
jgi:hypothetical protein